MPTIILPDGSSRRYEGVVTAAEVAADIGPGLARDALAAELDGQLVDLCDPITGDARLRLITATDPEGLEVIRHSCAHLLGQAVKQLFPEAQLAIGPVIEHGFYYDIAHGQSFTPADMARIAQRMAELIDQEYDVVKRMTARAEALRIFRERGESYKLRLIEELPQAEELGLYHHQEYIDMCLGPHVPNTRFLKAFQLSHLAGAYWRGDTANEMLQRIYGTAWATGKQLREHLRRLEEAQKRDHRRLGARLDLFHFEQEAPGMVFWHQRGWALYRLVENHIRRALGSDYHEVHTPQMLDRSLWERSGHWDKFGDMIFATTSEKRDYAVKPMNCPAHVRLFQHQLRSHRELPYRIAEFGIVHRNEPSGTLHGLMRARCFTQDDAHIFCAPSQLGAEIDRLLQLVFGIYRDFGFAREAVSLALSTRPQQRVGGDALWDRAEQALSAALSGAGLEFGVEAGEGAFYGPKIDFTLCDSLGRQWQCGTIQVDFSMPERLGAHYIDEDSARRTPVMIHRAVLGSLERFIGVLIEHHDGALPLWLAPVQAVAMNISDASAAHARRVADACRAAGARVETDLRNEKIGFKIRHHSLLKLPYLLVVGERESKRGEVSVRARGGEDLGAMSIAACVALFSAGAGAGKPERDALE